jgi:hypothetical protein
VWERSSLSPTRARYSASGAPYSRGIEERMVGYHRPFMGSSTGS